jgi:hypothetical protein
VLVGWSLHWLETITRIGAMAITRSAGSDRQKSRKSSNHWVSAIPATAIDSRAFGGIVYSELAKPGQNRRRFDDQAALPALVGTEQSSRLGQAAALASGEG